LEECVFTHFTRLEIAPAAGVQAAGEKTLLRSLYANPAAYPYKLRPNTFYADGWRLPQLARVFARRVAGADEAAAALMQRWVARPEGQDYEAFYEAQGGAAAFEDLFLKGVTPIPTFEAYNGAYTVAEDYTVQSVEGGRAVSGLHQIMAQEVGMQPAGTILKVLVPGFVTATQVVPAQVVVSSGINLTPVDALLPNLALPHPHVAPHWGACWLPTKPRHFALPAVWDWLPNGHFAQVSGPLWCPQHYVYASTLPLVRATRKPLPECPGLLALTPALKKAFAPAVAQTTYDTISERTQVERAAQPHHALLGSALDPLPLAQPVVPLGYQALPASWPKPSQAAWFPSVGGQPSACPAEMAPRLAPMGVPVLPAEGLKNHHNVLSESLRQALQIAENPTATDDPHTSWLPDLPNSQLQLNVKRLFANRNYRAALTLCDGTLPTALYRFKEKALAWRRLRHRLVAKYPAALLHAESHALGLSDAEVLAHTMADDVQEKAMVAKQGGLTRVPAPSALPLHQAPKPVKLKRKS
jgi:hypothetical protein